ncbi:Axonemal dynein light chain domain-containing protein 1-like isoform X2 [Oopsacas minuta]|uniref:Axonemal dynein light chain domain-containing protein 1-like isoform X2 n=1 Tax=Oopsacas minuta TaxID=111878 RepID=A0AAV7JWB3_9METZ|nr:Axonemal dynein light chain domain-containing protein 1-like isoform X2 [Oopsacas minuta]
MTAASPCNALIASKTTSMPLISSDSVWHFSDRRKQLNHLIKDPPCSCGAGPNTFSFIYEDTNGETNEQNSISETLIPNEYKLYRHPGVLGLEPIEDKYSVRAKQHPAHMTVFPSLKPVSRKEVVLLRQTMHDMLLKLRRDNEKTEYVSPQTQLHELMDIIKKEQEVYNTVFHEIIRQVSIHCLEQGQLLSELREQYSSLFSRIPRQIRGLHDELVAQRALDRRLATELRGFQYRVSNLTGELDDLKQHEVKVSGQALSAQEDLSKALSESEKNAGLLTEYHELYELQRRRLEGVTLKISSEKELWQQTAYDLALKVSDEYNLYTIRQLQLNEKKWYQLAGHFIVLLIQTDTQKLFDIELQVNEWKDEFSTFSTELIRREESITLVLNQTLKELNSWREFLQEYLDTDGFRKYPRVEEVRDLWEYVRKWEQVLSEQGDYFNGEPLVSLQDQLKQSQKCIEAWTQISLRLFQFHPGRLLEEHSLMETTNQHFFSYQESADVRVSGENGVAEGLMRLITPLESWGQKLNVMIGNLEKHIPDQNWVKFQIQLCDWSKELEDLLKRVGTGVGTSEEGVSVIQMPHVIKSVDKWLGLMMTSVDKENAGCGDQVTSLHANLINFMIKLLLKLTESITSDLVPTAPKLTAADLKIQFSDVIHELSAVSDRIHQNCTELTAEISGKLREAGAEDPDDEVNELKLFQTETNEWIETAKKLIQELIAIDNEEIEPPKLERSTRTLLEQEGQMEVQQVEGDQIEGEQRIETQPLEDIDSEVSAICIDKNARSVSIEQLTADTQIPDITSYLEQTELPSSHAMDSINPEEVVRELGEAKIKVTELEKKILELEVEVKSKQTAEQNALEKIAQLEELVEKSKPKSSVKPASGKVTPKRTPSSQGRTAVTPSRSTK